MPLFEPWSQEYIDRIKAGLSQLETSGGQNLAHEPQTSGIHAGTTAGGTMGIMPETLKDQIRQSKNLGMPIDPRVAALTRLRDNQITNSLNKNKELDNATQDQLLRFLLHKKQGNEAEVVEAHRRGIRGASKTNEAQTLKDPYVHKYFQNLFDLMSSKSEPVDLATLDSDQPKPLP